MGLLRPMQYAQVHIYGNIARYLGWSLAMWNNYKDCELFQSEGKSQVYGNVHGTPPIEQRKY